VEYIAIYSLVSSQKILKLRNMTFFKKNNGITRARRDQISTAWAPLQCKLAVWLIVCGKIWTANRLAKHGLPRNENVSFAMLLKKLSTTILLVMRSLTFFFF
jgi:hypothetical protein